MTRILITGGAGAIGSRLVHRLCYEHQILVLDDFSSGRLENLHGLPVQIWHGSVHDDEILKEIFSENPTIVLHLAANFANQNSVDYPQKDLSVNGMGILKLLQYALDTNVERFIYTSSSCIYGHGEKPFSENMSQQVLDTPYAITKLLGEQYVNFFHQHHGMPTVILRIFNSYGPGEYPGKYRNVIPNFMFRALQDIPLIITGTGKETRDFSFVDDVVQGIELAMTHTSAIGQTFNLGTGIETSISQLAEAIQQVCGKHIAIEYQPRRKWDGITHRCANISMIQQKLKYNPTVDLLTGLRTTYEWFVEKKIVRD